MRGDARPRYQNKITAKNPQVTANHLMFNMNFYEAVLYAPRVCVR